MAVRDRYRTRMERGAEAGTTEIYISHRGAEQTYIGDDAPLGQQDDVGKMVWQPRPSDPGLEAEMLSRLMLFLGVDEQRATAAAAEGGAAESRARLVDRDGGTPSIALDEGFSRAWRRTGAALDRAGFTVDDRDRSRGLYFLQYASRGDGAKSRKSGWLSRLKFWEDAEADEGAGAYLVRVVGETEATSSIVVLDEEGNPQATPTAARASSPCSTSSSSSQAAKSAVRWGRSSRRRCGPSWRARSEAASRCASPIGPVFCASQEP